MLLIRGNDPMLINHIASRLGTGFVIKELKKLHYFLRIEATYFPWGIFLTYFIEPRCLRHPLCKHQWQFKELLSLMIINSFHWFNWVTPSRGKLAISNIYSFDITYAVHKACLNFQNPTLLHLLVVKRIFRYLKGTMNYGLRFFHQSSLSLYGFYDVDWASYPIICQSTNGYCIFLALNCIL